MATSGTYAFNPAGGELILYAYSLCGIRRTELLIEHMVDARMALNLMFTSWGNDTPNLWTVDVVEETLIAGTATYNAAGSTVMILDAYIRTGEDEEQRDRIIWPVSRSEYASYPNKNLQAPPTVFWFDRQIIPTITLWQVPDDQQTYTLRYYRAVALQDASERLGQNVEVPPRWLDALVWGLAARLAVSYAPDRAEKLDMKAEGAHTKAMEQDTENVAMYIAPAIGGYYPR